MTPGCSAKRILVAERSPTMARMLVGLLRQWGYDPVRHDDAASPAMGQPYDLVIAESGPADDAIAAVRRRARASGTPWLALISRDEPPIGADADGWAYRPIRPEHLRETVERCLRRGAGPGDPAIDDRIVKELWGSRHDKVYQSVVLVFLNEIAATLEQIDTAVRAVDRRRLTVHAHSITSAAANVGARSLADAGRTVEMLAPEAAWHDVEAAVRRFHESAAVSVPALRRLVQQASA